MCGERRAVDIADDVGARAVAVVAGFAEQLDRRPVGVGESPVGVEHANGLGERFEHGAQHVVGRRDTGEGVVHLGDVGGHQDHLAAGGDHARPPPRHRVGSGERESHRDRLAGLLQRLDTYCNRATAFDWDHIGTLADRDHVQHRRIGDTQHEVDDLAGGVVHRVEDADALTDRVERGRQSAIGIVLGAGRSLLVGVISHHLYDALVDLGEPDLECERWKVGVGAVEVVDPTQQRLVRIPDLAQFRERRRDRRTTRCSDVRVERFGAFVAKGGARVDQFDVVVEDRLEQHDCLVERVNDRPKSGFALGELVVDGQVVRSLQQHVADATGGDLEADGAEAPVDHTVTHGEVLRRGLAFPRLLGRVERDLVIAEHVAHPRTRQDVAVGG